jgi:hypothetical protein
MTAHHVTPSAPGQPAPAAPHRPARRSAAVGIAVTILIAAGGYGATRILGADSTPTASTVSPSAQAMHELHDTVVALYGPQPPAATNSHIAPRDDVMRELRETTIALYASGD